MKKVAYGLTAFFAALIWGFLSHSIFPNSTITGLGAVVIGWGLFSILNDRSSK